MDPEETREKRLVSIFRQIPAFSACEDDYLLALARSADVMELRVGEELDMDDDRMYILEFGAVLVSAGDGPSVLFGEGAAFNTRAVVDLDVAREVSRPSEARRRALGGREVRVDIYDPLLSSHRDHDVWNFPAGETSEGWSDLICDSRCLFNVCPFAFDYFKAAQEAEAAEQRAGAESRMRPMPTLGPRLPGQQQVTVRATQGMFKEVEGGETSVALDSVVILALTSEMIREPKPAEVFWNVASPRLSLTGDVRRNSIRLRHARTSVPKNIPKPSPRMFKRWLGHFSQQSQCIANAFCALRRRHAGFLPDVPDEVLWRIAEISHTTKVPPGGKLLVQGSVGFCGADAEPDCLLLIKAGTAQVERMLADEQVLKIAVLGPSAVIGDFSLIGAQAVACASVTAVTEVEVIIIPGRQAMQVFYKFPGVLDKFRATVDRVAGFFKRSSPAVREVMSLLPLFQGLSENQLQDLSKVGEICTYTLHESIKEQGAKDSSMYVLLYGSCIVEKICHGRVGEIVSFGQHFGERSFTGRASRNNAHVRAGSIVTTLLRFDGEQLNQATRSGCDAQIAMHSGSCASKVSKQFAISKIEALSGCSQSFRDAICHSAVYRSYLPGQLVIEEGAQDAAQTVVVCCGRLGIEKARQKVAELTVGASFGELLMLGLTQKRKVSIRALTFCHTVEISRSAFQVVRTKFPDENHFDNFFGKMAETNKDSFTKVRWKCAEGVPQGFAYSLNVACEHKVVPAGTVLAPSDLGPRAVHLSKGDAEIRIGDDVMFELHAPDGEGYGELFNQEVLLSIPNQSAEVFYCKSDCVVQLLHMNSFCYSCTAFWDHQSYVRTAVMTSLLPRLQRRFQTESGAGLPIMRCCPWFRLATKEQSYCAFTYMEVNVWQPGDVLIEEGSQSDSCHFIFHGSAKVLPHSDFKEDELAKPLVVPAPLAFGTAQILKIQLNAPTTVVIDSVSVVGTLKRCDFLHSLKKCPQNPTMRNNIAKCVQEQCQLKSFLSKCVAFLDIPEGFIDIAIRGSEHLLYAPGEFVVTKGESCTFGVSPCYVVMGGVAEVETIPGVFVPCLHVGDLFGEAGSLGLVQKRNAAVRARKGNNCGFLHVLSLCGPAVIAGGHEFPSVCDRLVSLFVARTEKNQKDAAQRAARLKKEILPLLSEVELFKPFPVELLTTIVCNITIQAYKAGATIFDVADDADSMVLVASGRVELKTKHGDTVGVFGTGASFGETALLGFLPVRPAKLQAVSDTRVAFISSELLEGTVRGDASQSVKSVLDFLRSERREQAALGLPLRSLPMQTSITNPSVRMLALHASRLCIPSKAAWMPLSDSSPDGPWFAILGQGRVRIEMVDSGRHVAHLISGVMVREGLVAENAAVLIGEIASEAYRFRLSDLLIAASTTMTDGRPWTGDKPPLQEWYDRCRLLERDSTDRLRQRFVGATGPESSFTPSSTWASVSLQSRGTAKSFTSSGRLDQGCRSRPRASWLCSRASAILVDEVIESSVTTGFLDGGSRPGSRCLGSDSASCWALRASSSLPVLLPSRPCSSGSPTKAFLDENTGCMPGDLLNWTLPPRMSRTSSSVSATRSAPMRGSSRFALPVHSADGRWRGNKGRR